MKYLALTILILLGAASTICMAQTPAPGSTPPPVPPPGRLLNRAPDFSQWTVSYKTSVPDKPNPGEKVPVDSGDSVTVVTKTKPVYHVQRLNGAGRRIDQWAEGGVQVVILPNAQLPLVSAPGGESYGINFTRSDFPDVAWVSRKNFADIKNVMGFDCLIFRDKVRPIMEGARGVGEVIPTLDAEAGIDIKSRLPIYLRLGDSMTTYVYGTAPSSPLVPPANIASLIQQWSATLDLASKVPPP